MLLPFDRDTHIPVLYQDEHLIAVHKPSGMVVHPTALARLEKVSLMVLVRQMVRQRVWPVHRLDRPTSGVVLFALNRQAASELGKQLRTHQIQKRYRALVRGIPEDQIIDYPLKKQPLYRSDRVCTKPQESITHLHTLASFEVTVAVDRYPTSRYALTELAPVTGRRHQLRRHLKHIFHPIIGDTAYGHGVHNRYFREHLDSHRLLLAAVELTIIHPITGLPLTMTAPLGEDFEMVLKQLNLHPSSKVISEEMV